MGGIIMETKVVDGAHWYRFGVRPLPTLKKALRRYAQMYNKENGTNMVVTFPTKFSARLRAGPQRQPRSSGQGRTDPAPP